MKQGSSKWHGYRAGKITASNLGCVLARPDTKKYKEYLQKLIDYFEGIPNFKEPEKPWFVPGKKTEPEARRFYEWKTWNDVIEIAYIQHPKYAFISCSPDGLIHDDGGLEIKCRTSITAHKKSVKSGLPSEHKPQVQGSLWISGRDWWDFQSYFKDPKTKEVKSHIHRVYPDQEYFKRLQEACLNFWNQVQKG
ncbi:MAG: YqaJ viral recombinase family protein [Deltaproteobacteria bacterium]|nr:YqaJ viral recombinase family protein [Deltaproteobacteria bacterium]